MDAYRQIARQLLNGEITAADLPASLTVVPDLIGTEILALSAQALERSHVIPREGWSLEIVAQAAAQRTQNPHIQTQTTLDLIEILIHCERYNQAIDSLDTLRPTLSEVGSAILLGRWEWLRGLAQSRMAHASEAAQSLATAGPLLRQANPQREIKRWQCDLARVKMLQAEYDEALTLAQLSLDYFQSQSDETLGYAAFCGVVIAAVHFSKGDYTAAHEWLGKSIAGFQSAGWLAEQVRAQLIVAQTLSQQYRFSEAIAMCEQIRPTLESFDLQASLARCDNTIGLIHMRQGNSLMAVPHFERARDGFTDAGIPAFAADSDVNLGHIYYDQGDLHQAISQYQRARDLYYQHGHPMQVAHCDHNLGRCHRKMGDYGRAIDCFIGAESAFAEIGSQIDLAICRHNLANTFSLTGDLPRANNLFNRALALYEELGLPLVAAECRTDLALIVAAQGDLDSAMAHVDQARQICAGAGYEPGLAICEQITGNILSNAGQYEASINYYRRALSGFSRSQRLLAATLCELGLANAYLNLGNFEQARAYLDQAVLADERVPDVAWWAEAIRSQLAQARGEMDAALVAALRAVAYLSQVRRSLSDESAANSFLKASPLASGLRSSVYDQAVRLALRCGHLESALQVIEEHRAQVMAERLRWGDHAAHHSSRRETLYQRRTYLQAQIAHLRESLCPGFDVGASVPETTELAAWQHLRDWMNEYQELVKESNLASGASIESPHQAPPFSLGEFQQTMRDLSHGRSWTCLSYAWLGEQLVIAHLDHRGKLDITLPTLKPLDRMALRMLSQPESTWRQAAYHDSSAGEAHRRRAYEVLIPPSARGELAPGRLLLIAPSGILHSLSFAALQTGNKFLAQQAILSFAPSLQVLNLLRSRPVPPNGSNQLLTVAMDEFGNRAPALSSVNDEVETLTRHWQDQVNILQGDDATPEAIRRLSKSGDLKNYRVIHFATHAIFGGEFGRLSRLLLRHGDLLVDDVRALRMAAQLVVLSACQTGLSQIFAGDETVGLAYSFLAAGAQTVMASLWHVNDSKTSDLMGHVYTGLKSGNSPSTALTWAQRFAIANGWLPYSWAAFSTIGLP